jgi:hypothetical protein
MNAGTPLTRVVQWDLGAFYNDDWKLRPSLTLSYGLRYERQTNLAHAADWSPRLGIAWGLDGKGNTPAKTVLRMGAAMFYNRANDSLTLNAIRFNGVTQQSYLLSYPDFFPNVPSTSVLSSSVQPQTLQLLSHTLQAPQLILQTFGVDRQVNKSLRFSANFNHLRAVHFLRSRDINARLPQSGEFPYGDNTVRMQTESSGSAQQDQLVINPTFNYKKVSIFGNYVLGWTKADFDNLPADPYNLKAEWARAFDIRHRLTIGPTFPVPGKLIVNTLFIYNSGQLYNITTGLLDPSGDGAAVQRPALVNIPASGCTGATLVYSQFGCFDLLPASGTPTIPRNYGRGPSSANMTIRVSRTWDFIKREAAGGANALPAGAAIPMKYHLTLSVYAINPLNHPNFGTPDGNLTSPFFGKPLNLQGTFTPGNATYNRKVTLQAQLTF